MEGEETVHFSLIVKMLLLKKVMKSLLLQVIGTEGSTVLWGFVSLEMVLKTNLGLFLLFSIND